MLVTFEGLDAAGKSSLLRDVAAGLRSTLPEHVLQSPDISGSPTGRRLGEVFRADELFARPRPGAAERVAGGRLHKPRRQAMLGPARLVPAATEGSSACPKRLATSLRSSRAC